MVLIGQEDLIDGPREPIVVETKADLQTGLELLPVDFIRNEKADSLGKYNYSYHGKPIKSDYMLYPEKALTGYLELNSGNREVAEALGYISINKFNSWVDFSYLNRQDMGDRSLTSAYLKSSSFIGAHQVSLKGEMFKGEKSEPQNSSENNYLGVTIGYEYDISQLFEQFSTLKMELSLEDVETDSLKSDKYVNFKGVVELNPYTNYIVKGIFGSHYDQSNMEVLFSYENIYNLGLWSNTSAESSIVAPFFDIGKNWSKLGFSASNKPYLLYNSFNRYFKEYAYGNYSNKSLTTTIPVNARAEASIYAFVPVTLGVNYVYQLDTPIYRNGANGTDLYNHDLYKYSIYLSSRYEYKIWSLSGKIAKNEADIFNLDYEPFQSDWTVSVELDSKWRNLTSTLSFSREIGMVNESNMALHDSDILDLNMLYKLNSRFSFWGSIEDILNSNHKVYYQDEIKDREFKLGVKIFY